MITETCVKHSFDKNRDKFRKEINKILEEYADKFEER